GGIYPSDRFCGGAELEFRVLYQRAQQYVECPDELHLLSIPADHLPDTGQYLDRKQSIQYRHRLAIFEISFADLWAGRGHQPRQRVQHRLWLYKAAPGRSSKCDEGSLSRHRL